METIIGQKNKCTRLQPVRLLTNLLGLVDKANSNFHTLINNKQQDTFYIFDNVHPESTLSGTDRLFSFGSGHNIINNLCYHVINIITEGLWQETILYRVIHKSVKYFKNSQQIHYSTDHGGSYADRERNSQSFFFLHISQVLNVSTFGNTADIYAIVHLVPHACQHTTVDQSHSSGVS